MRNGICAIVIGMLITMSCGSNATGPSGGQSNNWWPMDKGNTWTFWAEGDTVILTVQETGISMPFGTSIFLLTTNSSDTLYWENSSDILRQWYLEEGDSTYSSVTFLEFPLSVGKTWTFDSEANAHCVALDTTITVPAGTFTNCAKIKVIEDEEYISYYYYHLGTGLIMGHNITGDRWTELISFSLN